MMTIVFKSTSKTMFSRRKWRILTDNAATVTRLYGEGVRICVDAGNTDVTR